MRTRLGEGARRLAAAGLVTVLAVLLAAGAPLPAQAAPAGAPTVVSLTAPGTFNTYPSQARWTLVFTADKALRAGSLLLSDAFGDPVRSLPLPAAAKGAKVTATWDGTDSGGEPVPSPATYAWQLVAAAADGSGDLAASKRPANGTVATVSEPLGTVTPATPTISDPTPVTGQLLTAVPGRWRAGSGTVAFGYQWLRDGDLIAAADQGTYRVVAADLGHRLSVSVTGTADGWLPATAASKATGAVSAGPFVAPAPTVPVTTPVVDAPVTVFPGSWQPGATDFGYQWYRVNGKGKRTAVGGNSATYTPQPADVGSRLLATVTATVAGYATTTVAATPTGFVKAAGFTSVPVPTIGVDWLRVGGVLSARPGAASPSAQPAYQWYRSKKKGWKKIAKADGETYRLVAADLGHALRLRVRSTRPGYTAVSQDTAATGTILAGFAAVTPKLSDTTPTVGQQLDLEPGTGPQAWQPAASVVLCEWLVDGVVVKTTPSFSTYTVTPQDAGKRITLRLTGGFGDYPDVVRSSAASAKTALARFATVGAIQVNADAGDPETKLTVHSYGWTPEPTLAYQWYRNGKAITGADQPSYDTAGSAGTHSVRVTASLPGYTSVTLTWEQ
jgi:hypothetical protein